MTARTIQLASGTILLIATFVCGRMLDPIVQRSEAAGLRYTDVSVEGAPPFVALGTAIGALRGLVVDYLWIKVHIMKEKGLFYEVMADADLITKLQPRFAAVWAFHGHNMAYNISVATQTVEERWEWVNAGIRLVREEGLRHNPNNLVLHKDIAFWFAHKIEGYADDAHLFYKRAFCSKWHDILGPPPEGYEARTAWIKAIADAPPTLADAERESPGVLALIDRLNASLTPFGESQEYAPTTEFLRTYGLWRAVTEQSAAAEVLGIARQFKTSSPFYKALDEIAADPSARDAWDTLVRYTRRRVLLDEYNMDPQLMYEYTRDLGPIDWRHGQAHALYWSRRGSQLGEARVARDDDIYKIVNNDRLQLQALQGLARHGRITFDPFSNELPGRFPEKAWIDTIETMFEEMYTKHYDTRGAGGDTFIGFLENFMGSALREAYRSGEHERAERIYKSLDDRFGRGAPEALRSPKYAVPIGDFVASEVKGEIQAQPNLALSEASMSLRYALRVGVGRDQRETYENAIEYVDMIIKYFRGNEYNDYVTRYGEGRMKELISGLEDMRRIAFSQLMTDPTILIEEKQTIWNRIDKYEPELRLSAYDLMVEGMRRQYAGTEHAQVTSFDQMFPPPPGLEVYRRQLALRRAAEQEAEAEKRARDEMERK